MECQLGGVLSCGVASPSDTGWLGGVLSWVVASPSDTGSLGGVLSSVVKVSLPTGSLGGVLSWGLRFVSLALSVMCSTSSSLVSAE